MRRVMAAVLALLAGVTSHVNAQQQDTLRPFVRGGVYDKPYLGTILGRAAIGGYAEAHARYGRVDGVTEEAGFVARRFNLFASTRVSDFVRLAAELEVEEGGEELKLEFAAIDLVVHPSLTFRAGMLLSPLGRFNLAHDSPLNEFTDRPLVSTELIGVALSEPGAGILGAIPFGFQRLTYELYAVNGYHAGLIDDAEGGTRIPLGRSNLEDNNASPAFVGRVAWSPALAYEVGVSAHIGAYNEWQADGLELDERRDLRIVAIDGEATVAGLRVAGEYAAARIAVPATLDGLYASRQHGVFADLLYDFGRGWIATMPSAYFSAGTRLDIMDFDRDLEGDMVHQFTAGLNFRPTSETVFKLNYLRGRSRDRFNNPADHAGLLFSVATYF